MRCATARCRWCGGPEGSPIPSSTPPPDTLSDGTATGFAFDDESAEALLAAASARAVAVYRDGDAWPRMVQRAMSRDFSWQAAARPVHGACTGSSSPDSPLIKP